jgi:hypothetical protein
MSECQVVFFGELQPGQQAPVVQQKVAALFKASQAQIATFFSGQRVIVKTGLSRQKAEQYVAALAKAGAIAHIEVEGAEGGGASGPTKQPAPEVPASQRQTSQPRGDVAKPQIAPADDVGKAVVSQVDTQKLGELNAATLAPVGATLQESNSQAPVEMDLGHLSLSEVGSDLQDAYDDTPPLEIDLSHLSVK